MHAPLAGYSAGEVPPSLITPDELTTRIGRLTFVDGAPSQETLARVRDNLDFMRALDVFMNAHQGASTMALRKGFLEAGAQDNDVIIFSELMDSKSLFLTANADTVYYVGIVDLTSGPMVLETPPDALGVIDDMWFRHVVDFGRPGPDRARAAATCCCRPTTRAPCPTAASTSRKCEPAARSCSDAAFSPTRIQRPPSKSSSGI